MRLLERPQLTLGHDGNRREHHGPVLAPLKTQRLPGVALAERDLATLSDDFDFDVLWERFYCLHAIMLSCERALRQTPTNWSTCRRAKPASTRARRRTVRAATWEVVDFKATAVRHPSASKSPEFARFP